MPMNSIVIVGGGPAGLYAAALLKQQHADADVTVYERDPFERTLGFGIGLSSRTREALAATDPEIYEQIERAGTFLDEQDFRLPTGRVVIRNPAPSLNVERAKLREIVADVAVGRGVTMKIGSSVSLDDIDGDLVVIADGVNSSGRRQLADELGATVELGRELYLWCGADFALPSSTFAPVTTEHGTFTTHAYRYRDDRSTVLIETDEATWKRAGFDRSTDALADADPGASDDEAIAYLQTAFDEILEGHRLLGNRSRWTRFPTVRCERWSHGSFVLLGDAAHTAHYSLGSGTKAAMEDAIGLAAALRSHDDVSKALAAYEHDRHPTVNRLQTMAQRSQWWWESLVRRLDLAASRVAISYLTRGGSITLDKLRATSPDLVTAAIGDYLGGVVGELPDDVNRFVIDAAERRVDAPATEQVDAVEWTFRDSEGTEADSLVAELAGQSDARVCVRGSDDRDRLIDQLAFCERIRLEAKRPVDVALAPTTADLGAAALVAGRIDRVLVHPHAD